MLSDVAPWLVVTVACVWLTVWALCLLMALRFILALVAAAVMTARDSLRRPPPDRAA